MKYSACSVLIASLVLVVSVQQSDAGVTDIVKDALNSIKNAFSDGSPKGLETIQVIKKSSRENRDAGIYVSAAELLRDLFLEAANLILKSEATLLDGIKLGSTLIKTSPEAANTVIQQACENAKNIAYSSGPPFFKSFGGALALSSSGAKEQLEAGSHLIQEAGFAILETIDVVCDLSDLMLKDGGKTSETAIEAMTLAAGEGYTGAYNNIQTSIKISQLALRNAPVTAIQPVNQNCGAAATDAVGANAVKAINEAANQALARGANNALVVKFRDAIICFLSESVPITFRGRDLVQGLRPLGGNLNAQAEFAKGSEVLRNDFNDVYAKIFVLIGEIAQKAGKLARSEVSAAVTAVEEGKVQIIFSIEQTRQLIATGSRLRGEAPELALEAGSRAGLAGKYAAFAGIAKGAVIFLNML